MHPMDVSLFRHILSLESSVIRSVRWKNTHILRFDFNNTAVNLVINEVLKYNGRLPQFN
jgi:hypothetical protein